MSALEFIAAVKWPITLLLLVSMCLVVSKRSPGTRRAVGQWLSERDIRANMLGQAVEITRAETQDSMALAASSASALVETESQAAIVDAGRNALGPEPVELLRQAAIENVARRAVHLGWRWSQAGAPQPDVTVLWGENGHPNLQLNAPPDGRTVRRSDDATLPGVPAGAAAEMVRTAVGIFADALRRQGVQTVAQHDAMQEAIRRRLQRERVRQHETDAEPREAHSG